uniref:Zinc metalloproteinase n=1 Tax=Strongyloides venezuelensis TaxID=75913 RepID=A0A0K0FB26_STRVS
MTKNIIINLLLFLCFNIAASLPTQETNVPKEDRNNFEITKKALQTVEEIEEKIEEKYNLNNRETPTKGTQFDISNFTDKSTIYRPMENPDLFQGDEVLTEEQAKDLIEEAVEEARNYEVNLSGLFNNDDITRKKRKIEIKENAKWDFPIKYYIHGVNETLVDISLKLIEKETCIKFEKERYYPTFGTPGLKYIKGNGCWSFVGRKSPDQFQDVSIGSGCTTIGTVQHETMHALGSIHEHCRADRNDYLNIIPEHIGFNKERNFRRLNFSDVITYNITYDYGSDMQYAVDSFTKDGEPTMLPKNPLYSKTLGVSSGLTFLDVKLLNFYYCSNNSTEKIKCYNGGYEDPNNKGKCKCVEGYGGDKCIELPKPKEGCNTTLYHVTENAKNISIDGEQNCLYHLKAPHGKRINITVLYAKLMFSYEHTCKKENSLEIKFISNKTPTGALLCSENRNISIITENDHAIIHYRSTFEWNNMNMTFHAI